VKAWEEGLLGRQESMMPKVGSGGVLHNVWFGVRRLGNEGR
jgi:hypothetical protein